MGKNNGILLIKVLEETLGRQEIKKAGNSGLFSCLGVH